MRLEGRPIRSPLSFPPAQLCLGLCICPLCWGDVSSPLQSDPSAGGHGDIQSWRGFASERGTPCPGTVAPPSLKVSLGYRPCSVLRPKPGGSLTRLTSPFASRPWWLNWFKTGDGTRLPASSSDGGLSQLYESKGFTDASLGRAACSASVSAGRGKSGGWGRGLKGVGVRVYVVGAGHGICFFGTLCPSPPEASP